MCIYIYIYICSLLAVVVDDAGPVVPEGATQVDLFPRVVAREHLAYIMLYSIVVYDMILYHVTV